MIKSEIINITTPVCLFQFAWLVEPDTKFDASGIWQVECLIDPEKSQDISDQLTLPGTYVLVLVLVRVSSTLNEIIGGLGASSTCSSRTRTNVAVMLLLMTSIWCMPIVCPPFAPPGCTTVSQPVGADCAVQYRRSSSFGPRRGVLGLYKRQEACASPLAGT